MEVNNSRRCVLVPHTKEYLGIVSDVLSSFGFAVEALDDRIALHERLSSVRPEDPPITLAILPLIEKGESMRRNTTLVELLRQCSTVIVTIDGASIGVINAEFCSPARAIECSMFSPEKFLRNCLSQLFPEHVAQV